MKIGLMWGMMCFVSAVAAFAAAAVSVPVERLEGNNLLIVAGTIEGRECSLLLDTGATHTTFDLGWVKENLPAVALKDVIVDGTTNVRVVPKSFVAESLRLGEVDFQGFPVFAVPLGHLSQAVGRRVDGILGMNLLGAYDVRISAREGRAVFSGEAKTPEPVTPKLTLGGVEFLVDTGSTYSFVNAGKWPEGTGEVSLGATDVNGTNAIKVRKGLKRTFPLDGTDFEFEPLLVQEDRNFIGADVLRRYDLVLTRDGRSPRVVFSPVAQMAH